MAMNGQMPRGEFHLDLAAFRASRAPKATVEWESVVYPIPHLFDRPSLLAQEVFALLAQTGGTYVEQEERVSRELEILIPAIPAAVRASLALSEKIHLVGFALNPSGVTPAEGDAAAVEGEGDAATPLEPDPASDRPTTPVGAV